MLKHALYRALDTFGRGAEGEVEAEGFFSLFWQDNRKRLPQPNLAGDRENGTEASAFRCGLIRRRVSGTTIRNGSSAGAGNSSGLFRSLEGFLKAFRRGLGEEG